MDTGKDSVVIGNISPESKVGEGGVVIGPTHPNGSINISGSFAAGRGAQASDGSIAIGANAKAGIPQNPAQSARTEEPSTNPPSKKPPEAVKNSNKPHSSFALVAIATVSGVLVLLCGYFITEYFGIQL